MRNRINNLQALRAAVWMFQAAARADKRGDKAMAVGLRHAGDAFVAKVKG